MPRTTGLTLEERRTIAARSADCEVLYRENGNCVVHVHGIRGGIEAFFNDPEVIKGSRGKLILKGECLWFERQSIAL